MKTIFYAIITVIFFSSAKATAQEHVAPIGYNPFIKSQNNGKAFLKSTSLSLPFFEDFDQYTAHPDTAKWTDRQVYINNTMCLNPISRGVATFDALDKNGMPYDTTNIYSVKYADSLTSKAIDLSSKLASDSIYLSFFYQAGGYGFGPESSDSLMLFFKSKTSGVWKKVWSTNDTLIKDFKQVLIPIKDTNYLFSGFQFRFVNKASIGINDDVWNIDYVYVNSGRSISDTIISDIAYTSNPSNLLNDYTSMPYRQFLANPSSERSSTIKSNIRNNFNSNQNIDQYGYEAFLQSTGASLATDMDVNKNINAKSVEPVEFPNYSSTPSASYYDKVIFENKFYLKSPIADSYSGNDTIISQQIFDNYLAYDDGTAEMSYFLNLFPTLPGKIAIEHHLNQADTIRGVAIYFGRQVPLPNNKFFSVEVYEQIAYGSSSADVKLYSIENLKPEYQDSINHYWIYKFERPIPLKAGTFFIGTTQPALSGSDSLYFGLDRNRNNGNHAYYNVLNVWTPSLVSGAIMIRPLLGQDIVGSGVKNHIDDNIITGKCWPNPAQNDLFFNINKQQPQPTSFQINDLLGQKILDGKLIDQENRINVEPLASGQYLIQFYSKTGIFAPIPFTKK